MIAERPRPVSQAEYELLAGFRYGLRRFLRFSEEAAHAAGITPQQQQALLAVKGFPGPDPITMGELAERLQVRPHSAVGLVDRLLGQGLLVREPDAADRRQVRLRLTRRGGRVLEKLTAAHREELRRLGPQWIPILTRLLAAGSADEASGPGARTRG